MDDKNKLAEAKALKKLYANSEPYIRIQELIASLLPKRNADKKALDEIMMELLKTAIGYNQSEIIGTIQSSTELVKKTSADKARHLATKAYLGHFYGTKQSVYDYMDSRSVVLGDTQHEKFISLFIELCEMIKANKLEKVAPMDLHRSIDKIVDLIDQARNRAFHKVNDELVLLYYNVGGILSSAKQDKGYGDKFMDDVERAVISKFGTVKGFNRRGLYRMVQFYECYNGDEIVSPLVTQLNWTHHLMIMSASKSAEERQFYVLKAIKEGYSKRELERQLASAYFERYMLSKKDPDKSIVPSVKGSDPVVLDTYILEFLDLPEKFSENDLKKSLVANMKKFFLELGSRDFTFSGEEYRIQVGGKDRYIDLVLYNRSLQCLVAFELKLGEFEPEYISKMDFYLEALDRDHRKPHENPSVGIILCASKNKEEVEYAMSRSLSKTAIAEYQTKLPDKKLLQNKLHELKQLVGNASN